MASYIGDTKYIGPEKIIVGMDVGTTMTAVCYSYLYPDDYARVRMVNKWPGQPESVGSSKVPTILAYRQGQRKACGSEALEYVDDSQYDIAKWFKLHLHPAAMRVSDMPPPYESVNSSARFEIPPLPAQVPIDQVYSDFLGYLMENTQASFEQSIPNGAAVWRRLRDTMIVILTTPNGWDFSQQSVLRKAAIRAGLVKEGNAQELLDFITEGEASVHYALAYSQSKTWLSVNSIFAVVDAGGSTVDSTLYQCTSTDPKVALEEVCPSECIQAGGVFVDRAAQEIFERRLNGSRYGDTECISEMVTAFESRTKRLFDGSAGNYVVDFGGTRDNDRSNGIIKGKLSVTKEEVAAAFGDVINRIVSSCQRLLGGRQVKYLLLVGGFGESTYLQKRLRELFDVQGVSVVTVEEPSKKAAAEGALIWYIKQTVMARMARTTIGVETDKSYDSKIHEHVRRTASGQGYMGKDGRYRVRGGFTVILRKGTRMQSDFTHTSSFSRLYRALDDSLGSYSLNVLVWDGDDVPEWILNSNGDPTPSARELCTLRADLSGLREHLQPQLGLIGNYYNMDFQVAVRFGGTQLQARLQWDEGGILREGPVSIIPNATV